MKVLDVSFHVLEIYTNKILIEFCIYSLKLDII